MIPIKLSISGFLSYCDPVELDFTRFDVACISGPNGAGKSSLLDAITFALFGQARKRDESLINTQSNAAQVDLVFGYEGNTYRVQRTNPRGKSTLLEFHIQTPDGDWKPLTERTLRETDLRIQNTLRMDYETFVNAAFFLQGKADQFTQQRPGDRKRILGTILGLEAWEVYRQRAAERRRGLQMEMNNLDGRLQEINTELAEEGDRKKHLTELEVALERASTSRGLQDTALENIKKTLATLAEQRKLVETLTHHLDRAKQQLASLEERLVNRRDEQKAHQQVISRAGQIEKAHQAWQETRAELEHWEKVAARFREHEKERQEPLLQIEAARARLETEHQALKERQNTHLMAQQEIPEIQTRLSSLQGLQKVAEEQLTQRARFEQELQNVRQKQADAKAENPRLFQEMNELKVRIQQLVETEGATCPTCGQNLSLSEREALIASLSERGKEKGDLYRANKALLDGFDHTVSELQGYVSRLSQADHELRAATREADQFSNRLKTLKRSQKEWQEVGEKRLRDIEKTIDTEAYAEGARAQLAQIDTQLKKIGYDAAAHDVVRRAEADGRESERELRLLENARAALAPLAREISELEKELEHQQAEIDRQEKEHSSALSVLEEAESQAPDLESAERDLFRLREEENRLRLKVGAARQKVLILGDLKERRKAIESDREQLAYQVSLYKQLERAFGKDGVPALLIEQALPQIETAANEILDRLSAGNMSVRFMTQQAYKDKKRSDLKETLDIQISDSAGLRDYEMYSGGEAFRVNFAIRLALSEVLAKRAGARLQTLIMDEGFGSQDNIGRQRLIEAINLVRPDFAKILVITHIDELKDSFPTRIEVEKTAQGSQLIVN